ncbi:FlgN protein [Schinkia azotoformans MEV2011]|uniref:FlgN protein n=1 Tax=Schinkia azotoformans MEV2011 TaxID=1348973 RepID=A0A072NSX8_SCHAZ|nr:flagellar protein FlgN [Schinkia azotoformans]KEF40332.1 FlgN protein [Schinkia azotoformans MEV2011]MEC1696359.1 flagellar protein FlgN [Schinkia azotoformans]MEC1715529.1 flagellar protein FlgN [Schinkia azotoformans]MEC1724031.1 flagellar protein FlgN [Schinkia azotoformans]MEC1743415.1 flagellar protein FlgN [Schinkia azotoformans]
MSAEPLIRTLGKMLLLHKSLNQLAKQKTDILKSGDTVALNNLLKEEKKHIQALQKVETERQQVSIAFLARKHANDFTNPTIVDCINFANTAEKIKLTQIKSELQQQIQILSNQNELNQQLLKQSLQFVNLSLDILKPEIDTYNYERPGQSFQYEEGRSIFNSKA